MPAIKERTAYPTYTNAPLDAELPAFGTGKSGSILRRDVDGLRVANKIDSFRKHDCGPFPEILNPTRKAECEFDLLKFLMAYEAIKYKLEFANFHLDLIGSMQEAILGGGGFKAYAFPRGSGKTTLAESAILWGSFYGHVRYPAVVGATAEHKTEITLSLMTSIECNETLYEDFPEIIHPFRCLNHNYKEGRMQHYNGVYTGTTWHKSKIVYPYIEGSKAGSIVQAFSIMGRIRGARHALPSGEIIRPDFVLIDDPQTDRSARSHNAIDVRERNINAAIMGLSGPGEEIGALMPCTVIRQGDLAERFLDRDNKPEWQGTRIPLLRGMPKNMEMWHRYNELRRESFRAERGGIDATDFYIANRAAMDEGTAATWEARYVKGKEESAVQHAMNLYFRDPIAFASEYQNEPLIESNTGYAEDLVLTKDRLKDRMNGLPRYTVPESTLFVTTGVDIQGKILFYVTVGWTDDFGGSIVDYGVYPRQSLEGLDVYKPTIALGHDMPNTGLEPRVYAGLTAIRDTVLANPLKRAGMMPSVKDEKVFSQKCLIDANWALSSNAVYAFCRDNSQAGIYLPSHGRGVPASMVPMDEWSMKTGEVRGKGQGWRLLPATMTANKGRHASFDGNIWKNVIASRLLLPKSEDKALTFFHERPGFHDSLIQHLTAEVPSVKQGRGGRINEWNFRDGDNKLDNHLWDCLIMAAVGAGILGLKFHVKAIGTGENQSTLPEVRKRPVPVAPPPLRRTMRR